MIISIGEMNRILIFYDENLRKITGVPLEEGCIPDDFTFADFLYSLFTSFTSSPQAYFIQKYRIESIFNNEEEVDNFSLMAEEFCSKIDEPQQSMWKSTF